MRKLQPVQLRSWTLPFVVLALIGPTIAGFALGGPPAGLAVGALTATAVIVLAARARFDEPIEVGASPAGRFTVLVVALAALEDPELARAVVETVQGGAAATRSPSTDPQILVLAPALNTPVAHWLSDVRRARFEAQRRLALSLGTLAAAGLDARGQVGDTDPVQAVEDTLRTFPAQEVLFVTAAGEGAGVIDEVRHRLDRPVRRLEPSAASERERAR